MEHFEEQAARYQQQIARLKELEQALPQSQAKLEELQEATPEFKLKVAQAKFDLDKAENPGFFVRLLGKQEDLMEKARGAYRDSVAALDRHRAELAMLENRIAEDTLERNQLAGCPDSYRLYLEEHQDAIPLAHTLLHRLLAENAIEAAWGISKALERARPWMQADVRYTYVSEKNQKLALLDEADGYADQFCQLLAQLPDGLVKVGAALTSPSGYITGATMEYIQLDRLDLVLNQARDAREALRTFLKEL